MIFNETKERGGKRDIMSKKIVVFSIIIIIIIVSLVIYLKNRKEQDVSGYTSQNITEQKGPVDLSKTVVVEEKHSEKLADGGRVNTSTKLKEEKEFYGLRFTNISLVKQDGNTMLLADVENNSGKDLSSGQKVIVVFKDSTGKEIEQVECLLPAIKNGATGKLNSNALTASDNIVNAYDFEVKEAK